MSGQSSIVKMPQPLGLFGRDLFSRGIEYLEAFEKLSALDASALPHARYHLLAHSLELLLKGYLAACGVAKSKIFRFGHKLIAIKNACVLQGLPLIDKLEVLIDRIHEMDCDNDFRYPSHYVLTLPNSAECISVSRALVTAIAPIIKAESVKASVRFAFETRGPRRPKVQWSD